jgi:hypothetical protein
MAGCSTECEPPPYSWESRMRTRYIGLWLASVAAVVIVGVYDGWMIDWMVGNTVTAEIVAATSTRDHGNGTLSLRELLVRGADR